MFIASGNTDQTIYVSLRDTSGLPVTALTFESAGILLYYTRPGAAAVAITPATQTVAGAHSDGGFVLVSDTNAAGLYRLDLPDAAVAAGVTHVTVSVKFTATVADHFVVALPTTAASQADTFWDEALSGHVSAGTAGGALDALGTAIDGRTNNANLNALLGVDDAASADLPQEIYERGLPEQGTAQDGGAATIQLASDASASNDAFNGAAGIHVILLIGGTGKGQWKFITDYVGATTTATVDSNWTTQPDSTTDYVIMRME